jgi:MFS family permease
MQNRRSPLAPLILVNVFWIPLSLQEAALLAIAIPAALASLEPREHVAYYAVLASIISLINVFLPWPVGVLSDRLRGRGSTREAVALAGAALNMAGLVLAGRSHEVTWFAVWIAVGTIGQTISTTAYQAMLPDTIARAQWGLASGIRGAATLVGTVIGLTVAGLVQPATVFYACAGIIGLGAFSMLFLDQRQMDEDERAHVRDWHDFIVVFIARAFVVFGLSLLTTFVLYFFRDVLHAANPSMGTGFTGLAALVGAAAASILLGILSDRVRPYRKYIVAFCGIPMTVAAMGYALVPHEASVFVFALLFGVGYGGVLSTGWALALDAMPAMRDVARDLGIWGMATHVPAIIAPLAGGAMIRAFHGSFNGYRALFALAALAFALGSSSVLAVRSNGRRPAA